MLIHLGYNLVFSAVVPVPLITLLHVHPDRTLDLRGPDHQIVTPAAPIQQFTDVFGNRSARLVLPPGVTTLSGSTVIYDSGEPEQTGSGEPQVPVEALDPAVITFLYGSRYCEVDRMIVIAWSLFGGVPEGAARVDAICEWVNNHLSFGYEHARATRTALEAYEERVGVCRDFQHLAVTFCRCMNIPARYATGYLGDIGCEVSPDAMDFSAYFEVYLGGAWYPRDARHNAARIGRVLVARGRDAADVALTTQFGDAILTSFAVTTDLL